MKPAREIRADYDRDTIVVYQAYADGIADPALAAGRFVAPFSFGRMTWIKPSFLWLMGRSSWGRSSGQERILAVRITRAGWDEALASAVLTSYEPRVHGDRDTWEKAFAAAPVHVQWDPERSLRGAKLDHRSIQVGVGRQRIERYVQEWIVGLEDLTQRVRKMRDLLDRGHADAAERLLPPERPYDVSPEVRRALRVSEYRSEG